MPQNLRWFRAASFRAYALISLLALILLPTREGFAAHRPGREWLSETVLCVRCTSRKDLGERLVQVCLGLEGQSRGRKLSNRGGWQSKDLMQLKSEEFLERLGCWTREMFFSAAKTSISSICAVDTRCAGALIQLAAAHGSGRRSLRRPSH
ncbi:unnamed protein product [Effrenium voratum]|nr:unnamed protein product [Effrenium voratum]